MSDRTLIADVAPGVLFALAALVFAIGGINTGQSWFLFGAVLLGLVSAYQLYRLRRLYIE